MSLPSAFAWVLLAAGSLPFPAPKLIPASDALKSDVGTVVSIDLTKMEVVLSAAAGQLTLKSSGAQVVGADGRGLGAATVLKAGQTVRAYYVVDNGAIAKEFDVQS